MGKRPVISGDWNNGKIRKRRGTWIYRAQGENLMGRRGDREMGRLLNFGMRMAEWRIKN